MWQPKRFSRSTSVPGTFQFRHNGYRMMVIREQDRVRLISRDWARHFPLIVAAALKLRQKHFVIDGETVVLDREGVSDFDALPGAALCLRHARGRRGGLPSATSVRRREDMRSTEDRCGSSP
jgi:hypothetical protein